MKKYNKAIGDYGEFIASEYLVNNGYNILDRNFRNKFGEIDIICNINDILIFCEIKSRYTNSYGSPMESVTYLKQKQIIKLSNIYILSNKYFNYNVRYDVIEVILNISNNSFKLNHLKDAFRTYWLDKIFVKNDNLCISVGPFFLIPSMCLLVP